MAIQSLEMDTSTVSVFKQTILHGIILLRCLYKEKDLVIRNTYTKDFSI